MNTNADYTMATLGNFVGQELGVSSWVQVDQERINQFAQCTGDHQWIHVDVERARRESPFGAPIAHGFLTLSLLAQMGNEIGVAPHDAVATFNYGLNKVRFINPVKAGARLRNRAVLVELSDHGGGRQLLRVTNTVEIEGADKPALIAESLVLVAGAA